MSRSRPEAIRRAAIAGVTEAGAGRGRHGRGPRRALAGAAVALLAGLCAAADALSGFDVEPSRRQWSEHGATAEYYNREAGLAWTRRLGDWTDAAGLRHGDRPFATLQVADSDTSRPLEIDLTAVAARWVAGEAPNLGIVLRAIGPGGADFMSRESPQAKSRPALELDVAGSRVTRMAMADTYLTGSTVRALGHEQRLRVDGDSPSLLRFDLAGIEGVVERAVLRLTTTARQYGDTTIGVFLADGGERELPPPEVIGLALDHPGDRGLRGQPEVLLATGFESEGWLSRWSRVESKEMVAETVSEDPGLGFEPLQGRALKVVIREGQQTGLNLLFLPGEATGSEPEELYFRYYLRFADDWAPDVDGGKLPGLAGTYGRAGWGGRRSDGVNGWSTRGSFGVQVPEGNPLAGLTPVGTYAYYADMPDFYGSTWPWNRSALGVLERRRWYCIEQHVRLNTPGQPDGLLQVWVDGRRAFEKDDIVFRTTPDLKIERVWMNVFHGGAAPAPRDLHLYIDNVVVARRYIGPLVP